MAKMTPWFPPDIKPVRIGEYECKYCVENRNPLSRHYWDGKRWIFSRSNSWVLNSTIWRGLSRPTRKEK